MELKIKIDGRERLVQAQLIRGTLWLHYNGRTWSIDASTGQRGRKKAGGGGSSDKINSPMPGKVTKLLLKEGAKVAAGQAVLVMEAMKMEYTLKAEIAGTIVGIDCLENDQVTLGKTLVRIKPEAEG